MIDFFISCLDFISWPFSSSSWLVVLPFCVMIFSCCVSFFFRLFHSR